MLAHVLFDLLLPAVVGRQHREDCIYLMTQEFIIMFWSCWTSICIIPGDIYNLESPIDFYAYVRTLNQCFTVCCVCTKTSLLILMTWQWPLQQRYSTKWPPTSLNLHLLRKITYCIWSHKRHFKKRPVHTGENRNAVSISGSDAA